MWRLLQVCFLALLAVVVWLTSGYPSALAAGMPAAPSPKESSAHEAQATLDALTPREREAVEHFLEETQYVHVVLPDIVGYLDENNTRAAVALVIGTYHTSPRMAEVVVLLAAQANGRDADIHLAEPPARQ
jgi:hypothetical protein